MHPAFKTWAADAGQAYITAIWHEELGYTKPLAVLYESRPSLEMSQIDYLQLSHDKMKFEHVPLATLRVVTEKHTFHPNKSILELTWTHPERWVPVRGELFKPKGSRLLHAFLKSGYDR